MNILEGKVFNDPIHRHIVVSNLCCKVIDTPQFQRLRNISQLGGNYSVFPGASGNRFEHSIGVSHYSKSFARSLQVAQSELGITDIDILCVELAGLCHDLGHGPYSHLFEAKFLHEYFTSTRNFRHEHASIGIFDVIISENNLMSHFIECGLNADDIHFVKELILGDASEAPPGLVWKGRGDKTFLYDIVANKRNGIDVDKFDYFQRDCRMLGMECTFDCLRLMQFARVYRVHRESIQEAGNGDQEDPQHQSLGQGTRLVIDDSEDAASDSAMTSSSNLNHSGGEVSCEPDCQAGAAEQKLKGRLEICFNLKEAWNVQELFHTRYTLHKRAYQHRVSAAVELMIAEILLLSDPFLTVPGANGVPRRMSECPNDMLAYWRLTDHLLFVIQNSVEEGLQPARDLLHRLQVRELYKCVGEKLHDHADIDKIGDTRVDFISFVFGEEFKAELPHEYANLLAALNESDFVFESITMGYGKKGQNPLDFTTFFKPRRKYSNDEGAGNVRDVGDEEEVHIGVSSGDTVSRLLPRVFDEVCVRLYSKKKEYCSLLELAFNKWIASRNETSAGTLTPHKQTPRKRRRE